MIAVNNYIIVRKDHPETEHNGIILPYTADVKKNEVGAPFTGVVESVGEQVTLVSEKDRIAFNDMAGFWMLWDDRDLLLIMKEKDVIGIITDGN